MGIHSFGERESNKSKNLNSVYIHLYGHISLRTLIPFIPQSLNLVLLTKTNTCYFIVELPLGGARGQKVWWGHGSFAFLLELLTLITFMLQSLNLV